MNVQRHIRVSRILKYLHALYHHVWRSLVKYLRFVDLITVLLIPMFKATTLVDMVEYANVHAVLTL